MRPSTNPAGIDGTQTANRLAIVLWLALMTAACGAPPAPPVEQKTVEVFRCEHLLIAEDQDACTGDVVGPGELVLTFRPDPKTAGWEVAVDGLKALASECAFRGRFDQKRLSALQGRGETEIVCPIAATVDRQYHTLTFETRDPAPNTTLRVQVVFRRAAS